MGKNVSLWKDFKDASLIEKVMVGSKLLLGAGIVSYGLMVATGTGPVVAQYVMGAGDFVAETVDRLENVADNAAKVGLPTNGL